MNQSNFPPVPPPGYYNAPPPPSPPTYNDPQLKTTGSASSNAVISLVFGILSYLVCGLVGGIIAWVVGAIELKKIKRGESNIESKGMATAGMWLGIVNVIISIIAIIIIAAIFIFALTQPGHNNWKDV